MKKILTSILLLATLSGTIAASEFNPKVMTGQFREVVKNPYILYNRTTQKVQQNFTGVNTPVGKTASERTRNFNKQYLLIPEAEYTAYEIWKFIEIKNEELQIVQHNPGTITDIREAIQYEILTHFRNQIKQADLLQHINKYIKETQVQAGGTITLGKVTKTISGKYYKPEEEKKEVILNFDQEAPIISTIEEKVTIEGYSKPLANFNEVKLALDEMEGTEVFKCKAPDGTAVQATAQAITQEDRPQDIDALVQLIINNKEN